MSLKVVSFGTTKIQKLRRVTLDQNLLTTLGLDVGDLVQIELDTEQETVLIKRVIAMTDKRKDATLTAGRRRANK